MDLESYAVNRGKQRMHVMVLVCLLPPVATRRSNVQPHDSLLFLFLFRLLPVAPKLNTLVLVSEAPRGLWLFFRALRASKPLT